MAEKPIPTLLQAAQNGDRPSLARLLSLIERDPNAEATLRDLLASGVRQATVLGITGPPGAGKSSLINALLPIACEARERTAVLAVDPSSPFSGGALLGDRVRMQGHNLGPNVFIRSMASRGETGGLARTTDTAVRLLDACGWPLIVLETLGIGQVELDVMDLATIVVVVLNPGWGDTFQANKAGLTEAGDVFVINKADKDGVAQTRTDLQDSLALLHTPVPRPIVETVASEGRGLEAFWEAVESYLEQSLDAGILQDRLIDRQRRATLKILVREFERRAQAVVESPEGDRWLTSVATGEVGISNGFEQLLIAVNRR